jgi:cell wall assembly regulator SMI1
MENVTRDWNRIEAWLKTNLPEVIADLNPPASEDAINHAEEVLGIELPESFKALYRLHNGQQQQSFGVFFGQSFLSLEQMLMRYAVWKGIVIHDPVSALGADLPFTSTPEGAIQLRYADAAWIPFTEAGASENFGLAPDLPSFLAWVADELERGKARVYESLGMRLFDHADLGDHNLEDGLRKLLYNT